MASTTINQDIKSIIGAGGGDIRKFITALARRHAMTVEAVTALVDAAEAESKGPTFSAEEIAQNNLCKERASRQKDRAAAAAHDHEED